jgi:hypothetical protein
MADMGASPTARLQPKALIFDLMGTCTDWNSSILRTLHSCPPLPSIPNESYAQLAADWRAGFFDEIHRRFAEGARGEDIDITHRRVLDRLLAERDGDAWDDEVRQRLVAGWHFQVGECCTWSTSCGPRTQKQLMPVKPGPILSPACNA